MILALGLVIFVIGCCLSSYEDVSYDSQVRAERRHRELMRELEECRRENEERKRITPPDCGSNVVPRQERRARRRVVKDKDGNLLAEEITEEIING